MRTAASRGVRHCGLRRGGRRDGLRAMPHRAQDRRIRELATVVRAPSKSPPGSCRRGRRNGRATARRTRRERFDGFPVAMPLSSTTRHDFPQRASIERAAQQRLDVPALPSIEMAASARAGGASRRTRGRAAPKPSLPDVMTSAPHTHAAAARCFSYTAPPAAVTETRETRTSVLERRTRRRRFARGDRHGGNAACACNKMVARRPPERRLWMSRRSYAKPRHHAPTVTAPATRNATAGCFTKRRDGPSRRGSIG